MPISFFQNLYYKIGVIFDGAELFLLINPHLDWHTQIAKHTNCVRNRLTWMFPQHRPYSTHKSSLNFQPEVTLLSSHLLPVIPVSIQYLYMNSEKPIVYISFQEPLPHHCSVNDMESSIKRGFTAIDDCHSGKDKDTFSASINGKRSSSRLLYANHR